jgi:hypothetical protein
MFSCTEAARVLNISPLTVSKSAAKGQNPADRKKIQEEIPGIQK